MLPTRLLIIASAYHEAIPFTLPNGGLASAWQVRIDAGTGAIDPPDRRYSRRRRRSSSKAARCCCWPGEIG